MKRLIALAGSLMILLAACGGEKAQPTAVSVDPAKVSNVLLEQEGLFSDVLETVDQQIGYTLYEIDPEDVTDSLFYLSGGATAEELTVVTGKDSAAAQRIQDACRGRVDRQKEAVRDYQPGEVSKLEAATIAVKGNTVFLLVTAADQDGQQALDQALES